VELLERDAVECDAVLEMARKEVEDMARRRSGIVHHQADSNSSVAPGNMELMNSFYARLNDVKHYHSQTAVEGEWGSGDIIVAVEPTYFSDYLGMGIADPTPAKVLCSGHKRKHGCPLADRYDIASLITTETSAVRIGEVFTPEELYRMYLDLVPIYKDHVQNLRHAFAASNGGENADENKHVLSYIDFLSMLSKGLNTSIPESAKLCDRRMYEQYMRELGNYLTVFLNRTSPFLDVKSEIVDKAVQSFNKEWREKGGVDGWVCRMAKASMALDSSSSSGTIVDGEQYTNIASAVGIDLRCRW
jgi:hypothetical protein